MASKPASYSMTKLRRMALKRQGLLQNAPFGKGKRGVMQALEKLGYVQIDTISVVARAHHHVLHSRVPNYQPKQLDDLTQQGKAFEYWHHAAAYMPMSQYRFVLPRMRAIKAGSMRWGGKRDPKLEAKVLARVRSDGPLMAKDFETPDTHSGGWWQWKPAKHALERLFMQGDLLVASRQGFQKIYDLPERLLDSTVNTVEPSATEHAEYLLTSVLNNFGVATAKSVNYLQRSPALRKASAELIKSKLAAGVLVSVALDNGESVLCDPQTLAANTPAASTMVKILSPFDNSLIQRERAAKYFDFDYQIECYVPQPKRRYGYFCLPLLHGDTFIGRMDCKAHRQQQRFEIKQLHLATGLTDSFVEPLVSACLDYAGFNQCNVAELTDCSPKKWLKPVQRALASAQ